MTEQPPQFGPREIIPFTDAQWKARKEAQERGECRHTGENNCPPWCTLPQHCVNQVHTEAQERGQNCPLCGGPNCLPKHCLNARRDPATGERTEAQERGHMPEWDALADHSAGGRVPVPLYEDEPQDCGAGPEGCHRPLDQPCCRDGEQEGE